MATSNLEKGLAIAGLVLLVVFGVGMGGMEILDVAFGLVVLGVIGGFILSL